MSVSLIYIRRFTPLKIVRLPKSVLEFSYVTAFIILTGKNDLTRRVTHREAVCAPVIHSIIDAWHYEVLWTYMLTRLQRYARDFVRWILYVTLHTTHLKAGCQMHFIAHSQVHSRACSQGRSQLHSMAHSQPA
jgi:hypothetical protein